MNLGSTLLVTAIAVLLSLLRLPPFCALLIGAATAWFAPRSMRETSRFGHVVLKAAVVALGARIDLSVIGEVGMRGLGLAATTLALTCALGFVLTRALGIEREEGILITLGTAICGGSAIAAAAPVISARGRSIATALAIVFALNSVALVVFPWLHTVTELSAERFGEWCAIAIHDTSSVIGAAATGGERALEIATVTKLARSLWIVPCCLVLSLIDHREQPGAQRGKLPVPWFILGFIAVSALFQFAPSIASLRSPLHDLGQYGMTIALFLLGGSLDRTALRSVTVRHLALGLTLWLVLGVASYLAIELPATLAHS